MKTELEEKLRKMDTVKKLIIISLFMLVAYVFGYPNGEMLIIIGILIMVFGFWFKWHYQWTIDGSEYINEAYAQLEVKAKNNQQDLTSHEIRRLSSKRLFSWIVPLHFKLGIAIIIIGSILLIIK